MQEKIQWSLKQDDMYPYGIWAHAYRTGFYTSRPALKRYVRIMSGFLQTARQISVFANVKETDDVGTSALWAALGVVQHHDAVSGTERQHVAYDYARLLSDGADSAYRLVHETLATVINHHSVARLTLQSCPLMNISICPPTQALSISSKVQSQARIRLLRPSAPTVVPVILYNPLNSERTEYIEIPVDTTSIQVFNGTGVQVPAQIIQNPIK